MDQTISQALVPMADTVFGRRMVLASILIFLGLIFMCQPFNMGIYSLGFPTVLVGTVGYRVLDHLKKWPNVPDTHGCDPFFGGFRMMKKMINQAENLVNELLEGYTLAYGDKVRLVGDNLVARTTRKAWGKVALVTLGGSGHEPGLSGFVGKGLLDISVPGEIFAAPGPQRCLDAIARADRGAGVLFVVLNHAGDVLTANLTMEMAREQGINVAMVLVHDDIASGPIEKPEERRGLVGVLPLIKIAGAAAEEGRSLEDVVALAQQMSQSMRTLAVAFNPATHPITADAMFELAEDEMSIGVGQHGEVGIERLKMINADSIADLVLQKLLDDLIVKKGEELLVLVNGAGATTYMELFIVFRRLHISLTKKKIKIARSLIGEYITTQEQAGFQVLIARMDHELLRLWDSPCDSPYFISR